MIRGLTFRFGKAIFTVIWKREKIHEKLDILKLETGFSYMKYSLQTGSLEEEGGSNNVLIIKMI